MIFELVQLDVKPGEEGPFEAAFGAALELLAKADGCEMVRLMRSIENPSTFRLLVQWQTLEHHTVRFRGTPAHQRIKEVIATFVARSTGAEHHRVVVDIAP